MPERLDHGNLPFGWIAHHKDFTSALEAEENAYRIAINRATTKEERIAALKRFIKHMEGLREKIKPMGKCHLKYYEEYILQGETKQRKEELYRLTGITRQKPQNKPVRRSKKRTGISALLRKKLWKLPVWAYLAILILIIILASGNNTTAPNQISVTPTTVTVDGTNLGAYGKEVNGFVGYYIPEGTYTVSNTVDHAVQITVYIDPETVSVQQHPIVLQAYGHDQITIQSGEFVKLSDTDTLVSFVPVQ